MIKYSAEQEAIEVITQLGGETSPYRPTSYSEQDDGQLPSTSFSYEDIHRYTSFDAEGSREALNLKPSSSCCSWRRLCWWCPDLPVITPSRLFFVVLGALLLVVSVLILVNRPEVNGAYEAKCPVDQRVYYPLRSHWKRYTFMFCCPCCASEQHVCYEDMFTWVQKWYDDTLSVEQQISFSHHVWAAAVARNHRERKPVPLTLCCVLSLKVSPVRVLEELLSAEKVEHINRTLASRKDSEHDNLQLMYVESSNTTRSKGRNTVLASFEMDNIFARDQISAFLVEAGHGQDLAMFKMAFSAYCTNNKVYDVLFQDTLDMPGVVETVAEYPSRVEILIDDMLEIEAAAKRANTTATTLNNNVTSTT
ncbi:protein ORF5 [Cyprinid herpesvirus 2]|nr:protein ORF5 [Cyprinid herpesvirus 2]QAU54884.1 protein ORF5 [Cyprinid herpesvirus 2]